jgi:hypothetical protein
MKVYLKIAGAALFLCTTFAGCNGNDSSSSTGNPSPKDEVAQSLNGLSVKDLIKTKYQSAILECQLDFMIRETQENVTTNHPSENSVTWDLLADYADNKELKLTSKSQGNSVTADINIEKIDIQNANVLYENGQEYNFKNSPVIFSNTKVYSDGAIVISDEVNGKFDGGGNGQEQINEGISEILLETSAWAQPDPKNPIPSFDQSKNGYTVQVTCLLKTTPKTAYQAN